tara:strand:+ start:193 stop:351 length:159 start_codon:yes stop_codon:yes gene_type:complete
MHRAGDAPKKEESFFGAIITNFGKDMYSNNKLGILIRCLTKKIYRHIKKHLV